ncbi:MAG: ribosome biogenesis GTPase YlqF [Lachnospiraceae bacterium]|nr:ribosome biogenesis GTPase YlqF [Lachnospiraceae bacterium]
MNIEWYPGHMTKARRMMQDSLKLVDMVIELVDARLPLSSRNPDIDTLAKGKERLIILNKADMADPAVNKLWLKYYEDKGIPAITADSRNTSDIRKAKDMVLEAHAEKKARDLKRGIKNRPVRAMIAGIPNVGKSTFINSFAGKASAKTGNRPGVTKGAQWISVRKDIMLLDTPGLLWPKFDDQEIGKRLAIAGSINDNILDMSELAADLLIILKEAYPGVILDKYGVAEDIPLEDMLTGIAEARKCIAKEGLPDIDKAARLIIDDFRVVRLGRISLERPELK